MSQLQFESSNFVTVILFANMASSIDMLLALALLMVCMRTTFVANFLINEVMLSIVRLTNVLLAAVVGQKLIHLQQNKITLRGLVVVPMNSFRVVVVTITMYGPDSRMNKLGYKILWKNHPTM